MLSLKINDAPVEISPDFSITMNLMSPIFNESGSYSYPFNLANTPRNAVSIGFKHRVSSATDIYQEFKGAFLWKGITLFTGTVKLKGLSANAFEGFLMEGNGDWNYQRKKAALQEVDFDELVFSSQQTKLSYINSCINKVYPERDIVFPQILNKTYFDELPGNTGLHYFNIYINSLLKLKFTESGSERTIIVPMIYVRYLLKRIFEHLRYAFDDSFFSSDPDYNSLALYNSVDCNSDETGFFQYDPLRLLLNYHVPKMTMNEFFTGLESFFNIRFFVNNNTRTVRLASVDSIVKARDYIEYSKQIVSIRIEPEEQIMGYDLSMAMETDDEIFTARKELDDLRLSHLKDSVQGISDLNPWPSDEILDLRYVIDQGIYYTLWTDKAWRPWYDNIELYLQYRYRNKDQTIETKFSTLLNYNIGDDAVIGSARKDWKAVTGKLFFTRYVENGDIGNKVSATPLTIMNSLYYGGEHGLFNKRYKSYCDFRISTKLVRIVKQMQFSEIKDFDFTKKYMVNGVLYLVKRIQVVLKKDRIMPATLECYTCS